MENEIIHDAFSDIDDGTDELCHYGRKGMKWYQNIFTSGRSSGSKKRSKALKKARKAKAKKAEETKKAATEKQKEEDEKRRVIETGTAKEVLKYEGKLTQAEMQYVANRLNWKNNVKNLEAQEMTKGQAIARKIMNKTNDVTDLVNTGAKAWNTFANVYNAFTDNDVSMPKIDTNITSGNREHRKSEKESVVNKAKNAKAAAEKAAREKFIDTASRETIIKNFGNMSAEELKRASQRSTFESTIEKNWGSKNTEQTATKKTKSFRVKRKAGATFVENNSDFYYDGGNWSKDTQKTGKQYVDKMIGTSNLMLEDHNYIPDIIDIE